MANRRRYEAIEQKEKGLRETPIEKANEAEVRNEL
jgi:hypothetical protein